MAERFKILVVDEWLPLPINGGKKIRTINLLKHLAVKYSIDIICFADNERDGKHIKQLNEFGINVIAVKDTRAPRGSFKFYFDLFRNQFSALPFSASRHCKKSFLAALKTTVKSKNYDLIHFEWTQMAVYLKNIFVRQPVIISSHNVEATIWKRYYAQSKNFYEAVFYRLQMKKMFRFEQWAYNKADCVTAVSEADAETIKGDYGQDNVAVVSNGVDAEYFRNTNAAETDRATLLYFGAMDYMPNTDAVYFFIEKVMPLLARKIPNLRFVVVGSNPPQKLIDMSKKASFLEVTGMVDDVRPYYAKNAILVVPLRIGGGTRLKILEGMAMETPIVSTRIGAESLKCEDRVNILMAETPGEFCDRIVELINDCQLRERIVRNGRELVENFYDWNRIADVQDKVWRQAIAQVKMGN